jgi:hypothetical protein
MTDRSVDRSTDQGLQGIEHISGMFNKDSELVCLVDLHFRAGRGEVLHA